MYGGPSSNNKVYGVYMFGNDNTNGYSSGNDVTLGYDYVYELGSGLKASRSHQFLLGFYNAKTSAEQNDYLTIGSGSADNNRDTLFGVGKISNSKYLRLGSATLEESDLTTLKGVPSRTTSLESNISSIDGRVDTLEAIPI